jgi:hypothetical protein
MISRKSKNSGNRIRGLSEKMDARQLRAWQMLTSKNFDIRRFRDADDDNEEEEEENYLVKSQSTTGYYEVRKLKDSSWACECPDFANRRIPCKHIYAVKYKSEGRFERVTN